MKIELENPEWIKELTVFTSQFTSTDQYARLFGTAIGLLDYCRQNMKKENWDYVFESLKKHCVKQLND